MQHSIPAEHARHDLELIAGHAAGDLSDPERTRADALLRSCIACSDLRRDLVAIASATRTIPASAAPRDFRLTEAQAAGLRRGGWIKTLLRPFASQHSSVRPIAMAFTSLGLAGLMVANILPSLFLGGAASAPALGPSAAGPAASAGSAEATEAPAAVVVQGDAQATDGRTGAELRPQSRPTAALDLRALGSNSSQATGAPAYAGGEVQGSATEQPYAADRLAERERALSIQETNWMLVGSLVLVALGLALFGLRFVARRVR
jgi:hypothetical protein